MPDVNALYPRAPEPMNPLQTAGNLAGLMQTMNQNKLFAQQFQGRQAFGQILGQFTNPMTGETDWNGLMGAISQDPRASYMLPEIAQQQLARKQTEQAIFGAGQEQATKGYGAVNAALLPLMSKKDAQGNFTATPTEALTVIRNAFMRGQLPEQVGLQMLQSVPADPAQFQSWLRQQSVQALDAQSATDLMFPQPMTVGAGGQTVLMQPDRLGGTVKQIGAVEHTMTPGELAAPREYVDPKTKQTRMVTTEQWLRMNGQSPARVAQPSAPAGAMTPEDQAQLESMLSSGRGAAMANTAPAPAVPSAAGGAPGLISKLSPAEQAAAAASGTGSGKAETDMLASVAGSGERLFQLNAALSALEKAKTGPGTNELNKVKSFFATMDPGILKKVGLIDAKTIEGIESFDKANKYLQQIGRAQAADTGVSEGSLASALSANASTSISQGAAKDVLKANIGLERIKQAQAQAWDEQGQPSEQFQKWQAKWVRENDPRIYVFDLMEPKAQDVLLSNMNRVQLKNFLRAKQWAEANGYVD